MKIVLEYLIILSYKYKYRDLNFMLFNYNSIYIFVI